MFVLGIRRFGEYKVERYGFQVDDRYGDGWMGLKLNDFYKILILREIIYFQLKIIDQFLKLNRLR